MKDDENDEAHGTNGGKVSTGFSMGKSDGKGPYKVLVIGVNGRILKGILRKGGGGERLDGAKWRILTNNLT